jgi:hypothetical protein
MSEKVKSKPFKRTLPCELTEAEKAAKFSKAGRLQTAIAKVRDEMKAATAGHKEKLKAHQANLDGLLEEAESGTEERSVECYEEKDFDKKKAVVYRTDTGHEVSTRALAVEEMQEKLPQTEDAKVLSMVPPSAGLDDDAEEAKAPIGKRGRGRPKKG